MFFKKVFNVSRALCFCQTPDIGQRLEIDFAFTWDNNNKNNDKDKNNPHLHFLKGTVLGVKEQGLGIMDKR